MPGHCDPGLRGWGLCLPHYFPIAKQILMEHLLCARHLVGGGNSTEQVPALMELTFLGEGTQTVNHKQMNMIISTGKKSCVVNQIEQRVGG